MQNVLKIFPEDFFHVRRTHNFTRGVESLSQRHCDKFGIGLFLKLLLGFPQAQPRAFKADLVPRVYGGKHRSVGGLIAARSPHDRIDKLVDSLAGEAGNGDGRRFSKSRISNPVPDEIHLVRGENLAVLRFSGPR